MAADENDDETVSEKARRLVVRMPAALLSKLRGEAEENDELVSETARRLIRESLEPDEDDEEDDDETGDEADSDEEGDEED